MKRISLLVVLGCTCFVMAFALKATYTSRVAEGARLDADAPDSVQLAAVGVRPGRQLVAFVFGGSRCGFCQSREVKRALGKVRGALERSAQATGHSDVHVVGVAIDTDIAAGAEYLASIGADAFSELSIGSGWQNQHVVDFLHRRDDAPVSAPSVLVYSRSLSATLEPLNLTYGDDSLVLVVGGARDIIAWTSAGASLSWNPVH